MRFHVKLKMLVLINLMCIVPSGITSAQGTRSLYLPKSFDEPIVSPLPGPNHSMSIPNDPTVVPDHLSPVGKQTSRHNDSSQEVVPQSSIQSGSSHWEGQNTFASYQKGDGVTISLGNRESRLRLSAGIDAVSVYATKRPFPRGLPLFLFPESPFGTDTRSFTSHARQSYVNAAFTGPEIEGFQLGANVLAFFQNDNLSADDYGLLVYYAYGELKNENWRFAAGLQQDVFNPVSPTVIAISRLYSSGNTGSYRGQVSLERFLQLSNHLNLTAQCALSDPLSFLVTDDSGRFVEDNGYPNVETRIELGFGQKQEIRGTAIAPIRVGLSGLLGQLRTVRTLLAPPGALPTRALINTRGVGVDVQIALNDRVGVVGEFFHGQGIGDYNGGVLQSFNSLTFESIQATGGFAEVYCYFTPKLHLHLGYATDDPQDSELAPTQIRRNQTYYATLVWNWSESVELGLEIDYRKTDFTQFLPNAFLDSDALLVTTRVLWKF